VVQNDLGWGRYQLSAYISTSFAICSLVWLQALLRGGRPGYVGVLVRVVMISIGWQHAVLKG
jgi:hypothetical protein